MYRIRTAVLIGGAMLGACTVDVSDDIEVHSVPQAAVVSAKPDAGLSAAARPSERTGGASNTPIVYNDPNLRCYKFAAHRAPDQRAEKYAVPSRPDFYVGFNIKAPWSGTQYIKSFRSIIDNKQALHHWILYRNLNAVSEGILENTTGAHPDGEMLYGWAPGTSDLWLHRDVGVAIPAGTVFQLETHYNNQTGAPVPDASGVEICVTSTKPAHVAALSYLGEDRINGVSATGHCTPASQVPVHLILGLPHMHTRGKHMKVDLTRATGRVETIHDLPFDFNYQRSYVLDDVVVQPGDKLSTTCTYAEPVRFGKGTNDEMCFFFTVHWPAGALARRSRFTDVHGPNTCIDE